MSDAAFKRLSLLRDLEALPVPVADDAFSPFGFRFQNAVLCLTYQGRDVAFVPKLSNEDKSGFDLLTTLPDSTIIDSAYRNAFTRVRSALDHNGKILAQQKRDDQKRRSEHQLLREQEQETRFAREMQASKRFFTTHKPQETWIDLDPDMLEDMSSLSVGAAHDPLAVLAGGRGRHFTMHVTIKPYGVGDAVRITMTDTGRLAVSSGLNSREGLFVDCAVLSAEINRMIERKVRLRSPEVTNRVLTALTNLEAPRYALQPFRINDFGGTFHRDEGVKVPLCEGVCLSMRDLTLSVRVEDVNLITFNMKTDPLLIEEIENGFDMSRSESIHPDSRLRINPDMYEKLASFWIHTLAEAHPQTDFSVYEILPAQDVETDAMNMTAGYDL